MKKHLPLVLLRLAIAFGIVYVMPFAHERWGDEYPGDGQQGFGFIVIFFGIGLAAAAAYLAVASLLHFIRRRRSWFGIFAADVLLGASFAGLLAWVGVTATYSDTAGSSSRQSAQIVGVPLPQSATDIRTSVRAGMFGGDYYVSAAMSHDDYLRLVSQLGLRHRPNLLQYWPGALRADNTPWWTVSSVNDAYTYFGDLPAEDTYIVTRYEGGRIYFKRHVY